jgi:L,D-transpeptidase-like protein
MSPTLTLPMRHPSFLAATIFAAISFLFVTTKSYAQAHTKGRAVAPFNATLKPGDYAWHPELSPTGPVVVLVSLPDQVLYVYRNGVRIANSTVSSGKPGKTTPTGVFTVLQKKVRHTSTIYKGAQMPHMQRLTWSGIALHAGHLPGYPASAGCVRMPIDFAGKLYSVTGIGTTVIIADNKSAPDHTVRPGLLFSGKTGTPPAGGFVWAPVKAPKGPLSVIMSAPDRRIYVYRNGVEIGRAPVIGLESARLSGTNVYSADSTIDSSGRRDWIYTASVGKKAPNLKELEDRISIDPSFLQDVRALIEPGTTLILTNAPVGSQTHSGSAFNILTTDAR